MLIEDARRHVSRSWLYLFIMKLYMSTQKNTKIHKKVNKELDYDIHNDSIIRSMSAAPKIESSA